MKRLVLVISTMLLFGFMVSSIGQEAFKFGVVDTNRVLQNYQKAIDADKLLKAGEQKLKEKLDEIVAQMRTLEEKKTKTELFVEKAQTDDLDNQIRLKQQEYQQEFDRGRQALLEKNRELMAPIYKELEDLIIETGKAENYDLLIDKQAVLYFNEKYDITDKLIKLINADAKKAEPKKEDVENQ